MRRVPLPLAALLLALLCLATGAHAATPPENIPLGSEPQSCATETSAQCQRWAIERLDAARAHVGLSAYALPPSFTTLSPDKQLLILTDLDRVAFSFTPVYGLNTNLSEAAQAGVQGHRDPNVPAAGGPWKGFGSDWASPSALIGYYLWMYDDGYGSPNGDCPTPSSPGCWGHRRVILGEAISLPQPQLMGAAAGSAARNAGSALLVSSNGGTDAYYTWAQAQQEGAGREEPPVTVPPETPVTEAPATPPTTTSSGQSAGRPAGSGAPARFEVLGTSSATPAQIAALLRAHLRPSAKAARRGGILKRGRITFTLPAGLRGTLIVNCFLGSKRGLLVARGTRRLDGSGDKLAVTLNTRGRSLLRHRGRVVLVLLARLLPTQGAAIKVSRPLVLTR